MHGGAEQRNGRLPRPDHLKRKLGIYFKVCCLVPNSINSGFIFGNNAPGTNSAITNATAKESRELK